MSRPFLRRSTADQPAVRQPIGTPHDTRCASGGFSMIEVLVVLALFSFGLLGVVAMQARAAQVSVSAEDSNRAALLAGELAAAMWGAGTVTLPTAAVEAWNARVADVTAGGLPNGAGTVAIAGAVATVEVTWRAPHEPSAAQHRYVTQIMIPAP